MPTPLAKNAKPSSCPECYETPGWLVLEDPGNGATRTLTMCPHRTGRSDPAVALRSAGVPERELAYTYDGLSPAQKGALITLEKALSEGQDVLLVGPHGSGKTGVSVIALQHAVARNVRVGYAYVRTLLVAIRASFQETRREGDRIEAELIEAMVKPELLLLDDLPDEQVSPHVRTTVLSILHQRRGYGAKRQTIVTSNPDLERSTALPSMPVLEEVTVPSIDALYGNGIGDRLREYRRIVLDADSRRRERPAKARPGGAA